MYYVLVIHVFIINNKIITYYNYSFINQQKRFFKLQQNSKYKCKHLICNSKVNTFGSFILIV